MRVKLSDKRFEGQIIAAKSIRNHLTGESGQLLIKNCSDLNDFKKTMDDSNLASLGL